MNAVGVLAHASGWASGLPQAVIGSSVVFTLVCLEGPRRIAGVQVGEIGVKECVRSCGRIICRCAPEVMGFMALMILALILRLRGDSENFADPGAQQVWEQIKVEWPILMGADTLLNLQAMVRLLVILFVAYRADANGRSPLSGMAALLSLAGALLRGVLNTRTVMYRLEGPLSLGGDLAVACEIASVPFLASFGLSELRRSPLTTSLLVGGALWFASHHYLNLAKNPSADQLFTQAHALEFMASFAYLARAICFMVGRDDETKEGSPKLDAKCSCRSGVFVGFMHILMTLQQAFSAYYFLTAFEPSPTLVGAGRPFCLLIGCNLLQLAAYLCATALFIGGCIDLETSADAPAPAAVESSSDEPACETAQIETQLHEDSESETLSEDVL